MKNTYSVNLALLILRIGVSGLMLTHGIPKLMILFGDNPIQFGNPIGIGVMASLILAVFAEVICSVLILIGFKTRLAAVPLIITMFVAYFIVHSGEAFKSRELSLFYLIVYIVLFIAGSGKFSVDYFTGKKR